LSLTIICLSFLIVGVFLSLSNHLRFKSRELSQNLAIVFYLRKDLPASEFDFIERQLRSSPLVGGVRVISPEQALDRFLKNFPELRDIIRNLEANPFPASIEVTLKDAGIPYEKTLEFIADMKKNAGIEDVQFNREWAEKIQSLGRLARAIGFFLGGILILASFLIISNVIRLNVLARRSEIEILRLVGATNSFIRIPFLLEGIFLGIAGSLLSLVLIFLVVKFFPVYLGTSLGALQELVGFRYPTVSQILSLLAGGGFVGFLGSLSSIARFLRI
jgi:cell division transport system permease protein